MGELMAGKGKKIAAALAAVSLYLQEEEAAAGSASRLALDQYLDGLSDYLPVLAAQIFHFDAQSRLLSTRRNLISSRISLARNVGGNWMDQDLQVILQSHQIVSNDSN